MFNSKKKIPDSRNYKLEKNKFLKFWKFIWYDDSLLSYVLNFVVAFITIKYIFFPVLGLLLGNAFPLVAIVSGSMEHKVVDSRVCDQKRLEDGTLTFDSWWGHCGDYYETYYDITKEEFSEYPYSNGLDIGDVMILYGRDYEDIEVGDVLVFVPQDKNENGESFFFTNFGPVIHRVVQINESEGKYYFTTKGDHNPISRENFERNIPQEDVIAVGVVRIPYIGYVKLALTNILTLFRG